MNDQIILNETKIHQPPSIVGAKEGNRILQVCTPDGICAIKKDILSKFIDCDRLEGDEVIVLIEIKCPTMRTIESNWTTKTNRYRSQVLTGLCTVPIAKFGLYLDFCYRRCALPDLGDNPKINPISRQERPTEPPLVFGAMYFFKKGDPIGKNRTNLEKEILSITDEDENNRRKKVYELLKDHLDDDVPVELIFNDGSNASAFRMYAGNDMSNPIEASFNYSVNGNEVTFTQDFAIVEEDGISNAAPFTITKTYRFGESEYLFEIRTTFSKLEWSVYENEVFL